MKPTKGIVMAAFLALFIGTSCNETQEENIEDTVDTIGSKVESGLSDIKDEFDDYRDETFVANVLDENAEILYLLQLAGTKGTASHVKDAATNMKRDHEDLRQKFTDYARGNNIDIKDNNYRDNLEGRESGHDWDDAWTREMTNKHERLINKFERKTDNANNPDLQQLTNSTISVLREHLNTLEQYKH